MDLPESFVLFNVKLSLIYDSVHWRVPVGVVIYPWPLGK